MKYYICQSQVESKMKELLIFRNIEFKNLKYKKRKMKILNNKCLNSFKVAITTKILN